MRQFHRFISEIRLWNAKRTHKRSVWVMVSLPVWMIFGLVLCSVTSVSEISFDLFERIFYTRLMILMKETKKQIRSFSQPHEQATRRSSLRRKCRSAQWAYIFGTVVTCCLHFTANPLTSDLCLLWHQTGRTPSLRRAARSVATRSGAPVGGRRFRTARSAGARGTLSAEAETRPARPPYHQYQVWGAAPAKGFTFSSKWSKCIC